MTNLLSESEVGHIRTIIAQTLTTSSPAPLAIFNSSPHSTLSLLLPFLGFRGRSFVLLSKRRGE